MHHSKSISVVIPCYNEEKGLDSVLRRVPSFIDEIIVVDNDSFDNTANVARRYGARLVCEKKRGYGQACLRGFSKAKGEIVLLLDGDGSYPIAEAEKLLLHMEETSCDFVIGCRYPLVNKDAQPAINQFANWVISLLIRILFKVKLQDSQSGMVVLKKDLLDKITICNTGMGFSQELKIRALLRTDLRCDEVNICYERRTGEVKFRKLNDSVKNLYAVLCLWRELPRPRVQASPGKE